MLRRHRQLRAKLSDMQKLHEQLLSADSPVHSHSKLMTLGHPSSMTCDQQSASRAAPSDENGGQEAGRTYRQCKHEGRLYSRQWHELSRQQLFSDWMHKPEGLEGFAG